MKKILLLIMVLLVFPIMVNAKTPNKEETFKVIENIENVLVDENIIINKVSINDKELLLDVTDNEINTIKKLSYTFDNNKLEFTGGYFILKDNKIEDIIDNDYAFYLYSILENKSTIPYDVDNYYNKTNIKKLVETNYKDIYKEPTNTFGITLKKDHDLTRIYYDYYLDGDYPVIDIEDIDNSKNPPTGNYTLIITLMLIVFTGIGVYTCMDSKKE